MCFSSQKSLVGWGTVGDALLRRADPVLCFVVVLCVCSVDSGVVGVCGKAGKGCGVKFRKGCWFVVIGWGLSGEWYCCGGGCIGVLRVLFMCSVSSCFICCNCSFNVVRFVSVDAVGGWLFCVVCFLLPFFVSLSFFLFCFFKIFLFFLSFLFDFFVL